MTEVLVYVATPQAQTARTMLAAACQATGIAARLEVYGSGSLYQRLGPRHAPPLPDIVMWSGPFAAHAAGLDGLLQAYQPPHIAPAAAHDAAGRWTTLDYWTVGAVGTPTLATLADLAGARKIALPDPERSEVGASILLSMLHRARSVEGDAERAWSWWQQRARDGMLLVEDDAEGVATVDGGGTSHALSLYSDRASVLTELAPIPNAIGLAASARNVNPARTLLDWLTSEAAASLTRLSPWQADANGLHALLAGTPALDVGWAREQYAATRRRWATSGFGPAVKG